MIRKHAKKAYATLTSPQAKMRYKQTGRSLSKFGAGAARYFEGANAGLDRTFGTYNSTPGKLTGVGTIPKGYKVITTPKIIKGPRGYQVYEETKLVRISTSRKKTKRKTTKKRRKR